MVTINLSETSLTINNTIVKFPIPVQQLQTILGECRHTPKQKNNIFTWDESGVLAYSANGIVAECLLIDFAYGNFDFSPKQRFNGSITMDGQDAATYYQANKNKKIKLFKADSGGAFIFGGISAWFSMDEDNTEAIQINIYTPAPQIETPASAIIDDSFKHLEPLWKEWISEILKIVTADNEYYNLTHGITKKDIEAAEKIKGFEIPNALLNFYKIYNVEYNAISSVFHFFINEYEYDLIPFKDIRRHWQDIGDLCNTEELTDESFEEYDEKVQATDYANPKWIPFADAHNGDYLLIDADPSPQGNYGQIIELQNETWSRIVVASSLENLLQMQIEKLKSGEIDLDAFTE